MVEKKFEKNDSTIALIFKCIYKMNIYPVYNSKHNSNHEKQIILLMILDGEVRYNLGVEKLTALLRGITSKYDGDFYCLIFLHSFRTKNKLKLHKIVCENKHF